MSRAWTVGMVLVLSGCGASQAARDVDPADQPDSGDSSFPDGPATARDAYRAADGGPPRGDGEARWDAEAGRPDLAGPSACPPLGGSPTAAQLQVRLDCSYAAANARLASMRAAHKAWKIPARPDLVAIATNVRSSGLKSDGTTDNTAALQSLLKSSPAGATLYFPAGTYRIDGPISITKPVTLFGETGTVFGCQKATQYVFTINKSGSLSSRMTGVTVTGIVVEGPGLETSPAMFSAHYLQNARFSYLKFRNIGYAALHLKGCVDVTVEHSVFDNVYKKGYGYGVAIMDYSDGITVRDSFFVTKGRHGITTGTANNSLPVAGYTKRVTVENNYFESFTDQAIDAHTETTGPYVARGNLVIDSRVGVNLRAGIGEISDNVFIDCPTGVLLRNDAVDPASIGSKIDSVVGNTIMSASGGMQVDKTNSLIRDNVIEGKGSGTAISLGPTAYSPSSAMITGNVVDQMQYGFRSVTSSSSGITLSNNHIKVSGTFKPF